MPVFKMSELTDCMRGTYFNAFAAMRAQLLTDDSKTACHGNCACGADLHAFLAANATGRAVFPRLRAGPGVFTEDGNLGRHR